MANIVKALDEKVLDEMTREEAQELLERAAEGGAFDDAFREWGDDLYARMSESEPPPPLFVPPMTYARFDEARERVTKDWQKRYNAARSAYRKKCVALALDLLGDRGREARKAVNERFERSDPRRPR